MKCNNIFIFIDFFRRDYAVHNFTENAVHTHNQGIAYLDDGTMVVIDNSRQLIGQAARVIVTSVLQTSAGRMIFAKLEDADKGAWKKK